ncbi:hypothetical protein PanWU01x14_002660, partial [Parasponia andersonii]
MNLFPFLNRIQPSTTLDNARERKHIGSEIVNKLVEQRYGVVGTLVLDIALEQDVPGNQIGFVNELEDGASVVEIVDLGSGVESQEARRYEGVVESAGSKRESVDFKDLFLGFTGLEKRERKGLK